MDSGPEDGDNASRSPLVDLYRLGTTYRWQVVHLSKEQTVAEHSFFVAMLFMKFAEICRLNPEAMRQGLQYSLLHDADEAWSGDIAGPVKHFLQADALPVDKMMGNWAWRVDKKGVPPLAYHLVKLADLVEAAKFLTKYGTNLHAKTVLAKYDELIMGYLGDTLAQLLVIHNGWDKDDNAQGIEDLQMELDLEILAFIDGKETYIDDYLQN